MITELLETLIEHAPALRTRLDVHQAVPRACFESFRRGMRKARARDSHVALGQVRVSARDRIPD